MTAVGCADALQREEREKRAAEEKATKKELRQLQHEVRLQGWSEGFVEGNMCVQEDGGG